MKVESGDEFILIFDHEKVKISGSKSIDKSMVDVGPIRVVNEGVIWKISVINFIPNEKRIFAKIIDYQCRESNFSAEQNKKINGIEIDKINFKRIDTYGLLKSSRSRNNIIISSVAKPKPVDNIKEIDGIKEIDLSFTFLVKRLTFSDGLVEFKKFIPEANRDVNFEIHNPSIKAEFDSIKNYFENFLRKKRILINAKIVFTNKEITSCKANSNEISSIDESAIQSVKFDFTNRTFLKAQPDEESNKHLYSLKDLYNELPKNKTKSSTFHASPEELMEDLISIKSSKHYEQLRYLSKKHLSKIMNLRFILKPFSFIFLLENQENYFIIWETLNTSEATYIWKVTPKSTAVLKENLNKINEIIGEIKDGGKTLYLKEKPESLVRVNHDYRDKENGTKKWIEAIEKVLD